MIATNSEKTERLRSEPLYTSRILKAGALVGDTKTLLSHWDVGATVDENITRIHRENVFGKASRSWVEDIRARQTLATEKRYVYREGIDNGARGWIRRIPHPPKSGNKNHAPEEDLGCGRADSGQDDNDQDRKVLAHIAGWSRGTGVAFA